MQTAINKAETKAFSKLAKKIKSTISKNSPNWYMSAPKTLSMLHSAGGAASSGYPNLSRVQNNSVQSKNKPNIGLSVGGAKDTGNFRENINNNYLPLITDITPEGLFYDYYFNTSQREVCYELFCPSYDYTSLVNPVTGELENYLSVGLNSGEINFERKKLNLVIVIDISGSMNEKFNEYYTDSNGKQVKLTHKEYMKSKISIAGKSIHSLIDQLNDDDRCLTNKLDSHTFPGQAL